MPRQYENGPAGRGGQGGRCGMGACGNGQNRADAGGGRQRGRRGRRFGSCGTRAASPLSSEQALPRRDEAAEDGCSAPSACRVRGT